MGCETTSSDGACITCPGFTFYNGTACQPCHTSCSSGQCWGAEITDCRTYEPPGQEQMIVYIVLGVLLALAIFIIIFMCLRRQFEKEARINTAEVKDSDENCVKLAINERDCDEVVPSKPTNSTSMNGHVLCEIPEDGQDTLTNSHDGATVLLELQTIQTGVLDTDDAVGDDVMSGSKTNTGADQQRSVAKGGIESTSKSTFDDTGIDDTTMKEIFTNVRKGVFDRDPKKSNTWNCRNENNEKLKEELKMHSMKDPIREYSGRGSMSPISVLSGDSGDTVDTEDSGYWGIAQGSNDNHEVNRTSQKLRQDKFKTWHPKPVDKSENETRRPKISLRRKVVRPDLLIRQLSSKDRHSVMSGYSDDSGFGSLANNSTLSKSETLKRELRNLSIKNRLQSLDSESTTHNYKPHALQVLAEFDKEGGFLEMRAQDVFLFVPPGALSYPTVLTMKVLEERGSSEATQFIPEIELGPEGTTFNAPVILSIRHTASKNLSLQAEIQQTGEPWKTTNDEDSSFYSNSETLDVVLMHFTRIRAKLSPIIPGESNTASAVTMNEELQTSVKSEELGLGAEETQVKHETKWESQQVEDDKGVIQSGQNDDLVQEEEYQDASLQDCHGGARPKNPVKPTNTNWNEQLSSRLQTVCLQPDSFKTSRMLVEVFVVAESTEDCTVKMTCYVAQRNEKLLPTILSEPAHHRMIVAAPQRDHILYYNEPVMKLTMKHQRQEQVGSILLDTVFMGGNACQDFALKTDQSYMCDITMSQEGFPGLQIKATLPKARENKDEVFHDYLLGNCTIENKTSGFIPNELWFELIIFLDQERFSGNDYRAFAYELGIEPNKIRWIENSSSRSSSIHDNKTSLLLSLFSTKMKREGKTQCEAFQCLENILNKIKQELAAEQVRAKIEEIKNDMDRPRSDDTGYFDMSRHTSSQEDTLSDITSSSLNDM